MRAAWVRAPAQQCRVNWAVLGRQPQAQVVVLGECQVLEAQQEQQPGLGLEPGLGLGLREVLEVLEVLEASVGKPLEPPAQQQRTVSPGQGA